MDISITPSQAAAFLLEKLTRNDWRISLKADGDLFVVVGDTPARMTQQQVFEHINRLSEELKVLLGAETPTIFH